MSRKVFSGVRVWTIVPCSSGFGQWESNGAAHVRKDSVKLRPDLDGLIRNQTGRAVEAMTQDGDEVVGMLGQMRRTR